MKRPSMLVVGSLCLALAVACGRTAQRGDETHFVRCAADTDCSTGETCSSHVCQADGSGDGGGMKRRAGVSVPSSDGGRDGGSPDLRDAAVTATPPDAATDASIADAFPSVADGYAPCCDVSPFDGTGFCARGSGVTIHGSTLSTPLPVPVGSSCNLTFPQAPLDATDSVLLRFVVIPPSNGVDMEVAVQRADGRTALQLDFEDGKVGAGIYGPGTVTQLLPYVPSVWNTIEALFRPATQDFLLHVNGVSAGPFPLVDPTRFPMVGINSFMFYGSAGGSEFRIDSVLLAKVATSGQTTTIVDESFEDGILAYCGSTSGPDDSARCAF